MLIFLFILIIPWNNGVVMGLSLEGKLSVVVVVFICDYILATNEIYPNSMQNYNKFHLG